MVFLHPPTGCCGPKADCKVSENRVYPLGLDIIAPCTTALQAPLAATVADIGHEAGKGNYGGHVLLAHAIYGLETFYSFYGYLPRADMPAKGYRLEPGEPFARLGAFHKNGNVFHDTHLQVITPEGLQRGYQFKGYCTPEGLPELEGLCPSPLSLFRT